MQKTEDRTKTATGPDWDTPIPIGAIRDFWSLG